MRGVVQHERWDERRKNTQDMEERQGGEEGGVSVELFTASSTRYLREPEREREKTRRLQKLE